MNYGYCRISTKRQKMERQVRNIKRYDPDTFIIEEIFTGTTSARPKFLKLLKNIKSGDKIIFDSVSRMSRNSKDGIKLYFELFEKGVTLIFLNEKYINTTTFDENIKKTESIKAKGEVDLILYGVRQYMKLIAEKQIKIAFEQAQKEVDDLSKRTIEGLVTAKLNGKKLGRPKGKSKDNKKFLLAKDLILKHHKKFGGNLKNEELIKLCGITKQTFYLYLKSIINESEENYIKEFGECVKIFN